MLVEKTRAGRRVVRLKGGDPFLFGRGGEEAEALAAAGLRFEIIPGVTSALSAPAYAGIPVTHRDHAAQLTIFTGHEYPAKTESSLDFRQLATTPGTKVMLMGVERIGVITGRLIESGASPKTPVALVRWGTTGRQQTLRGTLADTPRRSKTRFQGAGGGRDRRCGGPARQVELVRDAPAFRQAHRRPPVPASRLAA